MKVLPSIVFNALLLITTPCMGQWRDLRVSSSTDTRAIQENFRRASLWSARKLDRFGNDTIYGQPIFQNGVKFGDGTIQNTAIASTAAFVLKAGDNMTGQLSTSSSMTAVGGFVGGLTGNVTGSASSNVLKSGDTMTGQFTNTSSVTITGNGGEFGLKVSSNAWIVGYSSATKYYGDGSALTGLPSGDNLGNHVATTTLQMGAFGINTSSTIDTYNIGAGGRFVQTSTFSLSDVSGALGTGFQVKDPVYYFGMFSQGPHSGTPEFTFGEPSDPDAYMEVGVWDVINNWDNKGRTMRFYGDGLTGMYMMKTTGRIGVNTASPGSMLEVNGTSHFVGTATFAGATGEFGVKVSSNLWVVGYSSATKYYGDGSALTGITGGLNSTNTWTGPNTWTGSMTGVYSTMTLTAQISSCTASGGSITNVIGSSYCIHTFTSGSYTFYPNNITTADILIVGGGGGGGTSAATQPGGGGGAGGYRYFANETIFGSSAPVVVGAGGTANSTGSLSSFNAYISTGGGAGRTGQKGGNGGSGGGAGGYPTSANYQGGTGNTPATSPVQGYNGSKGTSDDATWTSGGGGGGSASAAVDANTSHAGHGGNGTANSITGTSVYYAGGSGGGQTSGGGRVVGNAGLGGVAGSFSTGDSAVANTGSGGGGGGGGSGVGGTGGSGIVVIRYLATGVIQDTTTFSVSSVGDVYVNGIMSAATITDRTPYPDSLKIAYDSVNSMERKTTGGVAHEKLDPFIQAKRKESGNLIIVGRDLSATVSAQNAVLKDLIERLTVLELKWQVQADGLAVSTNTK